MLPDNVLLEIFDLYPNNHDYTRCTVWKWYLLVRVCQRWRQIAFASPHRLNLQILCTYGTPVRKNLGIWPTFSIVVGYAYSGRGITTSDEDNVIAALEHSDRVCYLVFNITGSQLGNMVTVMQEPFTVLTHLSIFSGDGNASVLPAGFLGGSAPCLQTIHLRGIPFPTLPTVLLSANDLVTLKLHAIPSTGYISPEAMVASLAALPRLETLIIEFQSATPRPDQIRPPPVTRTVLTALISFRFQGASEYLENLVAQIDSPQLDRILIVYLNQLVDFQVTQLSGSIDRSVGPEISLFRHAQVTFFSDWVAFTVYRHANHPSSDWRPAGTFVSCEGIDWQVSHIAQVLSQFSATLSNVVHLKLEVGTKKYRQIEGTVDVEWPHLLHQFSAVQTLHVSWELAWHVALALKDITGNMVAEVLPFLDLIYLPGQLASSIQNFVAVR